MGHDIDGKYAKSLFGQSVALSDDGLVVAVGAPNIENDGFGHVRVFEFNSTNEWSQRGDDFDGGEYSYSGCSVTLSGDGFVVGIGAKEHLTLGGTGYAQVYEYPTQSPTNSPTKSPTQSPTNKPTKSPTVNPTQSPTSNPTAFPTMDPTNKQSQSPTITNTNPANILPMKRLKRLQPQRKKRMFKKTNIFKQKRKLIDDC
eukprot:59787_1